jgi:hypothetical protein
MLPKNDNFTSRFIIVTLRNKIRQKIRVIVYILSSLFVFEFLNHHYCRCLLSLSLSLVPTAVASANADDDDDDDDDDDESNFTNTSDCLRNKKYTQSDNKCTFSSTAADNTVM